MRVRILKCSKPNSWYAPLVGRPAGNEFNVHVKPQTSVESYIASELESDVYFVDGQFLVIQKDDCEIIPDLGELPAVEIRITDPELQHTLQTCLDYDHHETLLHHLKKAHIRVVE